MKHNTRNFAYRVARIALLATFFATPAFAGSQKLAIVPKAVVEQQRQFHSVLDAYLAANTSLETNIQNSTSLDDVMRNHLLAIVQTEKSELLSLRSKLYSTSAKHDIRQLAKEAQQLRRTAKANEDRIILPALTLSLIESSLLPTAEARLESMDAKLTKAQYDRAAKELGSLKEAVQELHTSLLSEHPTQSAGQQTRLLQTRMKNLYRDLRSTLK